MLAITTLFITALFSSIDIAQQSIAGVTYMDDFDFESRYRNVHECDPFYWHPLHLPAYCMSIFERLIRRRVGQLGPVRVVREREPYFVQEEIQNEDNQETYNYNVNYKEITPYEKMIWRLGKDVATMPIRPNITAYPGLGIVALYEQPVSRKNGDYIKKVAKAYKDLSFVYKPLHDDYKGTEESTAEPKVENKKEGNETMSNKDAGRHRRNKHKYNVKRKFNRNGVLTVVMSKHD